MNASQPTAALYIHVPFCLGKCRYCDFYSVPLDPPLARHYVSAAAAQIRRHADQLSQPLKSVFIGGGTPSVLGPDLLAKLIEPVGSLLSTDTEFSIEANPGAIDAETLAAMTAGGVNRVSLGVQSFDDAELTMLGRRHTRSQALDAIDAIIQAGIDNWSLDLIYALPEQSLDRWRDTMQQALSLGPPHLSCYALSFEDQTPLHDALAAGEVTEISDDQQRRQYELACDLIDRAGLGHYELSNFARPGKQCRHNLTYWRNEPYLGIGPAAASYVDGQRRTNHPDLAGWLDAVEAGRAPSADRERLTGPLAMAETLMLALRLTNGLDRAEFICRYGVDVIDSFPETIARYRRQEMLELTDTHLRLTPQAWFVSDTILADFVADAHDSQ